MAAFHLHDYKPTHTLSDFEFIHDPKDKQSKLGLGSFATVKLAREKKTGKLVALKLMDTHPSKASKGDIQNLKTEIEIHRELDHPNIIQFYGYIQQGSHVYLILEYAENGNLYMHLRRRKTLTEKEVFKYFYQTCLAINYLHENDIIHRDIKPENLLLDKDFNIKVCDFGWSAHHIRAERKTFCGTYEYMAPEIVGKKHYDYRVDVWALGVLLFELIHNKAPYVGRSMQEIKYSLSKGQINFSPTLPQEIKSLIQKILRSDPNNRLSLRQILSEHWVQSHVEKEGYPHRSVYHEDPAAHSNMRVANSSSFKAPEKNEQPQQSKNTRPLNIITQPIQQFFGILNSIKKDSSLNISSTKMTRADHAISKVFEERNPVVSNSFRSNTLTNGNDTSGVKMISPNKPIYLHTEGYDESSKNRKRIFDNSSLPSSFNDRYNRILENLNAKKNSQYMREGTNTSSSSRVMENGMGMRANSRTDLHGKSPARKLYPEFDKENFNINGSFKASIISNPEFGSPKIISYRNPKDLNEKGINSGRQSGVYHSFLEPNAMPKQMLSPKLGENRSIYSNLPAERDYNVETTKVSRRPIFADMYNNNHHYGIEGKKTRESRPSQDFGLNHNVMYSPSGRSIYNKASIKETIMNRRNF